MRRALPESTSRIKPRESGDLDKSFRIRKRSQITIAKGTGPVAIADLSGEKASPDASHSRRHLGQKRDQTGGGMISKSKVPDRKYVAFFFGEPS